ncbi:MAG: hypothetical protein CBD99_000860 [Candidatus Pelagibacter sp. TMED239]|jgi:hypothetical protein|nr:MAG: hypothetical protein CBD99_000860 [Candidatus Pelagibacter sp. TMED239]
MSTEIFYPMYCMLLLTVAVFLFTTLLRVKEIYIDKSSQGEDYRHALFPEGSMILRNAQKNHINLFEYPIFFYAVCIIIFITGNVDAYFVTLAYWFFYLRLAHSVYHIFFNHLVVAGGFPVRALIFVPALLTLIWMWIRLIGML